MKICARILIFSLLPIIYFLCNCPYVKAERNQAAPLSRQEIEKRKLKNLSHPLQVDTLEIDRVMEVIRPMLRKENVSILDLGAGTGTFTFVFADELKGRGKVFATDTDPAMVGHIQKRIQEGGYGNVFAVHVAAEGVDPFYKERKFDIIFICKVYPHLYRHVDYFRELLSSLNKGGVLYIISQKIEPEFTEDQLDDFKKIFKFLAEKEEDHPFLIRLDTSVIDFIRNKGGEQIPEDIKEWVIASFNAMLSDRSLFIDLQTYQHKRRRVKRLWEENLRPRDYSLASWLIVLLDKSQAFEKGAVLGEEDMRNLRMLNRLLILGTFGKEPALALHERGITMFYDKSSVIRTLEQAGFKFVREYDFLPKDYFLEFESGHGRSSDKEGIAL